MLQRKCSHAFYRTLDLLIRAPSVSDIRYQTPKIWYNMVYYFWHTCLKHIINANQIDSVDSGHSSGFCLTANTLNISLHTKRLHRQAQMGYNAWTSVHSVSSRHNGCDVASVSSARLVFIDIVIPLYNSLIVHKHALSERVCKAHCILYLTTAINQDHDELYPNRLGVH